MAVHRRFRRASLAVVLVTTVACGSTVQNSAQLSSGTGSGELGGTSGSTSPGRGTDGLGGPAGNSGPTGGSGVGTGSGLGSTVGGSSGGTSPTGSGGNGPAAPPTAGAPKRDNHGNLQGPGVTPSQVFIGIGYVGDQTQGNAAIGAAGITAGDPKGEAQAIINDINAHGGAGGRKLVPVFHAYSSQSSSSRETQDQAACADYTQDHKVFAVADGGVSFTGTLIACLAKAGVVEDNAGDIINQDQVFYRQYPHYIDTGTMTQDAMMAGEVAALRRLNYFSGWNATTGQPGPGKPKIGIISLDNPNWDRPLKSILLPALARAGHPVAPNDVYRIQPPDSYTQVGATAADVQSAALRFRQDGVTHVIFLDQSGLLTIFFAKNAKAQHYFPRFGANSATGMQALVTSGTLDADQLRGAAGMGWLPFLDLTPSRSQRYQTAAGRQCLAVLRKAHYTFSPTDTNASGLALNICDEIHLLARAIDGAAPSITLTRAQAVIDGIGARFPSAELPGMYLSPTHHAAARYGFDMRWDTSCSCTQYVGKGHTVG